MHQLLLRGLEGLQHLPGRAGECAREHGKGALMKQTCRIAATLSAAMLAAAQLLVGPAPAAEPVANDLREIRIGMAARDLPSDGYADLACASEPARKLSN